MTLFRFTVWFLLQLVFWCVCVPALLAFVAFLIFALVSLVATLAVSA